MYTINGFFMVITCIQYTDLMAIIIIACVNNIHGLFDDR